MLSIPLTARKWLVEEEAFSVHSNQQCYVLGTVEDTNTAVNEKEEAFALKRV